MHSELHQILLGCGFQYKSATQIPDTTFLDTKSSRVGYYVKTYPTSTGDFVVALNIKDDPYTQLPAAYLINTPPQYTGQLLPHVNFGSYLCYVDSMEADWDSNDLISTYRDVDEQIALTLNNSVTSEKTGRADDIEMEGEFINYWQDEETLTLLSKTQGKFKFTSWIIEKTLSSGDIHREFVSIGNTDDKSIKDKWLNQRGVPPKDISQLSVQSHYVKVYPRRLAGVSWPPQGMGDLLSWLKITDHNCVSRLIDLLIQQTMKRHLLLLDIQGQGQLAVYFELNRFGRKTSKKASKAKQKYSSTALVSYFSSKLTCVNFKRLGVLRADKDTLLSRNANRPSIGGLGNKRIALIGCGTIGGYLSGLLLRSGAGCGSQYLHLYDDDDMKPDNFSRHSLNTLYFKTNKAFALALKLNESIHIAKNIRGFNMLFPINEQKLQEYDIIIDATGRPPVSKRLAAITRNIPLNDRPVLVHAFNDGNGRASKVFIDTGRSCYGCLNVEPSINENGVDKRFLSIDQELEKKISCGSTYTPYDATVSMITASMAQEAVLNTLEPSLPWNYRERMFDGSRDRKPITIEKQLKCKICNE